MGCLFGYCVWCYVARLWFDLWLRNNGCLVDCGLLFYAVFDYIEGLFALEIVVFWFIGLVGFTVGLVGCYSLWI